MAVASSSSAPLHRDAGPTIEDWHRRRWSLAPSVMALPSKLRARSRAPVGCRERPRDATHVVVEDLVDPTADRLGDAPVERLGDPARHAGERVAVPAE